MADTLGLDKLQYEIIGNRRRQNSAIFMLEPETGLSMADANGLRKILLNDLGGVAVRAFGLTVETADGSEKATHRYCSVGHVFEDMAELIRNLRKITVKEAPDSFGQSLGVKYVFDSADFEDGGLLLPISAESLQAKNPAVSFANGDSRILALVREASDQYIRLVIRLFFAEGVGFVEADGNRVSGDPIGVIPIESQHSPVVRCAIRDDDGVVRMEIETNGSITPESALRNAFMIMSR